MGHESLWRAGGSSGQALGSVLAHTGNPLSSCCEPGFQQYREGPCPVELERQTRNRQVSPWGDLRSRSVCRKLSRCWAETGRCEGKRGEGPPARSLHQSGVQPGKASRAEVGCSSGTGFCCSGNGGNLMWLQHLQGAGDVRGAQRSRAWCRLWTKVRTWTLFQCELRALSRVWWAG